jgi:hypothetical protein
VFNFARSPESLPSVVRAPARVTALVLIAALIIPLRGFAVDDRKVPDRLDAARFWAIVSEFSEAGGSFPSHNFVSNETAFQTVIPRLTQRVKPGGVYIGVGPDQNFTYIAALEPSLAFIVDIRRQNMLHQLLYKALFELSPTRAEFMSRLFSRPRPADLAATAPADALFAAYAAIDPSTELYQRNLHQIVDRLTRHHGFPLTPDDVVNLEFVYQMFVTHGPAINYAPPPASVMSRNTEWVLQSPFPSFADLMTGTDLEGLHHAYLANETLYRRVREMQLRNAIVPVVGDFAGPKALRAIGDYVRTHGATVTALYTSNVEQYLFQNDVWRTFYANVAALPLDPTSTFIRSFFPSAAPGGQILVSTIDPRTGLTGGQGEPSNRFVASESLLCPVQDLLAAVADGRVTRYLAVIGLSK